VGFKKNESDARLWVRRQNTLHEPREGRSKPTKRRSPTVKKGGGLGNQRWRNPQLSCFLGSGRPGARKRPIERKHRQITQVRKEQRGDGIRIFVLKTEGAGLFSNDFRSVAY